MQPSSNHLLIAISTQPLMLFLTSNLLFSRTISHSSSISSSNSETTTFNRLLNSRDNSRLLMDNINPRWWVVCSSLLVSRQICLQVWTWQLMWTSTGCSNSNRNLLSLTLKFWETTVIIVASTMVRIVASTTVRIVASTRAAFNQHLYHKQSQLLRL